MIFVTSENHWKITSQVAKKSLFTVTNVLVYFLHAILCPEHTQLDYKQSLMALFTIVTKEMSFLTQHCDVTIIDLWRHANASY